MPFSHPDIFADVAVKLNSRVNPYVARLIAAQESGTLPIFYGPNLQDKKGQWKSFFQKRMDQAPRRLVVEIGCHLGKSLAEMAHRNPNLAFIGLDITYKRVVVAANKLAKIPNAVVLYADAKALPQLFLPGEIDLLVAFFPDPWNRKKRHQKKQLFSESFCGNLRGLLEPRGVFWLKTDQAPYFEAIKSHFLNHGLQLTASPDDLLPPEHLSSFEALFRRQSAPIYEGAFGLNP